MSEIVRIFDDAILNETLVRGNNSGNIIGEVLVSSYSGEVLFSKKLYKNDLLIGGCIYFMEKVYGKRSSFRPTSLDVELGVNTEIIVDEATLKDEQIIGIVCGMGGSSDIYNTVKPVQRHHRTVDDIVPFRYTAVELTGDIRKEYCLRVKNGDDTYSYFGKKFKNAPEIKALYSNELPVQNDVGDQITVDQINVFAESTVYISGDDIRERVLARDGSTDKSRINTIGLIAGYPFVNENGDTEYANVRTITTLNMENRELKNWDDTISIRYRQYII